MSNVIALQSKVRGTITTPLTEALVKVIDKAIYELSQHDIAQAQALSTEAGDIFAHYYELTKRTYKKQA